MENRYKVKVNSIEKIEQLLQEIYDQSCRMTNEIQNEINKLVNSTNLGEEGFSMESKGKYAKAMHDFMADKSNAIKMKFEIAKFMGELVKHHGDVDETLNDKDFKKATKLDLNSIRAEINKPYGDGESYTLKKK